MKQLFLLISLLLLTSLSPAQTRPQTRNLRLVKPPTENPVNQKRKAVVIGMSDYGGDKSLDNTLNDANDMATVFTRLGFEVTLLTNNDLRSLRTHLATWYNSIEGNDMAVFYFAGHGMEVAGENYLIPVDAELNSQTDAQYNTLNVNQVLGNMDEKRVAMKLIILDACRDNPFTRSWSRGSEEKGLSQMAAPKGTYITFAASPGLTAQDGKNYGLHNGVFTYFLKQEIVKKGLSIDEIFNNITGDVSALTHEQQTPFKNSSLGNNFYFLPPDDKLTGDKPAPYNPPTPVPDTRNPSELLQQANTYYNNREYDQAAPLYEQAATAGNMDAQNKLGNCYYNGLGVTKDYIQAVYWYKKAADQGSEIAQNNLGVFYENGYGVTKDTNQALAWYQKAADQGNISAQNALDRLQNKPAPPTPTPNNSSSPVDTKRNPAEPEMVFVQGGTFTMGCTPEQGSDCDKNEKPAHQVTLSSFYIGKYEVTQAQWKAVMGKNPSKFIGDNFPVEQVSWNDVQKFISKLNTQTGKQYRLPTEAEWEFACRGGMQSAHYKYSGSNDVNEVAWYKENSGKKTHPVGTKLPNELGIYDMSGNVWEWCQDVYESYLPSAQHNPSTPELGISMVKRGGSYSDEVRLVRMSKRDWGWRGKGLLDGGNWSSNLGFRIACSSSAP